MASDKTTRKSKLQIMECKSVPIPPGTKSRGRLPRPGDPEPTLIQIWWPYATTVIVALGIGVLIGRFLLG